MTPDQAIAGLNRLLDAGGSKVDLIRPGGAAVGDVRAKVWGLNAMELRPTSPNGQGNFRAIVTPSDLGALADLRTTDKVKYKGQQRSITYVNPVEIAGVLVRLELDFVG